MKIIGTIKQVGPRVLKTHQQGRYFCRARALATVRVIHPRTFQAGKAERSMVSLPALPAVRVAELDSVGSIPLMPLAGRRVSVAYRAALLGLYRSCGAPSGSLMGLLCVTVTRDCGSISQPVWDRPCGPIPAGGLRPCTPCRYRARGLGASPSRSRRSISFSQARKYSRAS